MIKRKSIFVFSFIFAAVITAILFLPVINVLSIGSRQYQANRFYSRDGYNKGFVISYTHSVNKGRVHDFYLPTADKKIKLDKTSFVSYGAGIPEPDETPGAVFTVTDDCYVISGINRIVPRLVMAVGLIAQHTISFDETFSVGQKEFYLTDFFEPQTSIIFEYKKISLFNYLKHKI